MPKISLLLLLLLPLSGFSGDGKREGTVMPYYVIKSAPDPTLTKNEAKYVFSFYSNVNGVISKGEIKFSCDGVNHIAKPDTKGEFTFKLKPGKHKFQFFHNAEHYEIYTDTLKIEPRYRVDLRVYFESSLVPVISDKPVIYLYPQITTNVNITMELKGEFLFTYPKYENGWSLTAHPDGTLELNEKKYEYLFWDGTTNLNLAKINLHEGFIVEKSKLTGFFEEKLTTMGLSAREAQDFITYWVPRMMKNENNYVHFLFNDEFSEYANLNITPKPDHLFRVYMIWGDAEKLPMKNFDAQTIPSLTRTGFSVVEWGGTEINTQLLNPF